MTDPKASFSAQWLSARERFDRAARDCAWPVFRAPMTTSAAHIRRIVDLGCGTGSNLRYLSRRFYEMSDRIPREALLVDADPALLAAARQIHQTLPVGIRAIEYQVSRLAGPHDWPVLRPDDLLSASALIDLVSMTWLTELLERCRAANASVLLALSYDGRSHWRPAHPSDHEVVRLFNLDQQSDKGLGPALGPTAADSASAILLRLGYVVWQAQSNWHLDARHAAARRVVLALIRDHTRIAIRAQPQSAAQFEHWSSTRLRQLRTGRLTVSIGHRDILALNAV